MAVQNVANFLMGPATIYVGASGVVTAAPANTAVNTTPAASAWTDIGGTDGGLNLEITPKFTDFQVDQIVDTPGSRLTSRTIMATFTIAETTLANLATALNTTVGATGTGFATVQPTFTQFASQVPYISVLMDGWAPSTTVANARRRIYFPRALSTGKFSIVYAKDKQVGFQVQMQAFYADSSTPPFSVIDQTA